MAPIKGSVEVATGNSSIGIVGVAWDSDSVAVVLSAMYGITVIEETEPTAADSGRIPEGQWTGLDANNQAVMIRLWREIPFEETYAAMIGPQLAEE